MNCFRAPPGLYSFARDFQDLLGLNINKHERLTSKPNQHYIIIIIIVVLVIVIIVTIRIIIIMRKFIIYIFPFLN